MTGKTAPGWKKWQSGNPKGRPKGNRNPATLLATIAGAMAKLEILE